LQATASTLVWLTSWNVTSFIHCPFPFLSLSLSVLFLSPFEKEMMNCFYATFSI
jgi:hypothetical protein